MAPVMRGCARLQRNIAEHISFARVQRREDYPLPRTEKPLVLPTMQAGANGPAPDPDPARPPIPPEPTRPPTPPETPPPDVPPGVPPLPPEPMPGPPGPEIPPPGTPEVPPRQRRAPEN